MAKILFTKQEIQNKVMELAFDLNRELDDATFLVVTSGATLFAMDLFKEMDFPCRLDFIKIKSYEGENQGILQRRSDAQLKYDENDTIVIIEDIVDSGTTIKYLKEYINQCLGVSKILVVSLLYKEKSKHLVDYPGFLVQEDDFVFGYGLDLDEYDRNHNNIYKK